MKKFERETYVLAAALSVAAGCGNGSVDGSDAGRSETFGPGSLVRIESEAPGANCAEGGQVVRAGRDTSGDGRLDDDEVEVSSYVCHGRAGDDGGRGRRGPKGALGAPGDGGGPGSLLQLELLAPGAECPAGGYKAITGIDANRNGRLEGDERTDEALLCTPATEPAAGFQLLSRFHAPTGPAAEIVTATPDGMTLAYTNAVTGGVEFVDITVPTRPRLLGSVDVSGEVTHPGKGDPTSVAITPNGKYAIVAVIDTEDPLADYPGALVFIDVATRTIAGKIDIGVGPDAVRVTPDGSKVLVAIEDEGATASPRPGSLQVVSIDYENPAASTLTTIPMTPDVGEHRADAQPEFIDVSADGTTAIVSLQENNAIAVIDLVTLTVTRYIDAGVATHDADLAEDGEISLSEPFAGRREPDAVCLLPGGRHFLTANEGDTSVVDGVYPGSRNFTLFDLDGTVVHDPGASFELLASRYGQYPDSRSAARGVEPEGCGAARFGQRDFAFVLGERNSSLTVLDVEEPTAPRVIQMLPAPFRPEGLVALPQRNLLVVAGEGDGGLGGGVWIYQAVSDPGAVGSLGPNVFRGYSESVPFGGISGGAWNGVEGQLVTTPDNVFERQRIWTFALDEASHRMNLVDELLLSTATGEPLAGYDPEGLSLNPEGGYVIATEGAARNGGSTSGACDGVPTQRNRLLFVTPEGRLDASVNETGIVDLPCAAQGDPNGIDWTALTGNGFEGVAVVDTLPDAPGGLKAYVAFQRPLSGGVDAGNTTRIGEYDVDGGTWNFYFYTLEPNHAGPAANVFLSDIAHLGGDEFVVVERDQRRTGTAGIKRLYAFRLSTGAVNDSAKPVTKVLAADLLHTSFRFDFEKVETVAVTPRGTYVINDNDGGEEAQVFYRIGPLVSGGAPGATPNTPASSGVVVNEVFSRGSAENPDYVELLNVTGSELNLAGWTLTDDDPAHVYVFPEGTVVPPGGRLVIAEGADFDFGLGGADAVNLFNAQGALVDAHAWTSHVGSAGRCPEGTGEFFPMTPTKGAPNECAAGDLTGLVINEISSNPNPDWVEFINVTAAPLDLSGWTFTDDDPSHVYAFPHGTIVAPGELLVLEQNASGSFTFGFGSADRINLYNPEGTLVDSHAWSAHVSSVGRCPDGVGEMTAMPASKGGVNTCE